MAEPTTMRVKQIYTYPIKSLLGISPTSLPAMYAGFPHDRHFCLWHVEKKKHCYIAVQTELCLFRTAFDDEETPTKVLVTYTKDHVFNKPEQKVGSETLEVELTPDVSGLETVEVNMHSSPSLGYDMGERYNEWFSKRLGYAVKLLYIGQNRRKVLGNMSPNVAGQKQSTAGGGGWLSSVSSAATSLVSSVVGGAKGTEGQDEGLSFADVAPYLVISSKSWEEAQSRLPEGEVMDISKFRPNIIVEGAAEEYEEDFWAEISIGDQGAKIVMTNNCGRCNSLNVDYNTGKVGEGEAGKILKKLNSNRRVDPGTKWSPVFGRYGFLAKVPEGKSAAEIRVGDEVVVVKRNENRTTFDWPAISTTSS